jgi:F-type H+-transporting ATPase subunit alpha
LLSCSTSRFSSFCSRSSSTVRSSRPSTSGAPRSGSDSKKRSVSRVGGKTQRPAYRRVASELRLAHSQYEELESFARFGTRLDEETRSRLEHGRRLRELLRQPRFSPRSVPEQIAVLVAAHAKLFEDVPLNEIGEAAADVREAVPAAHPDIANAVEAGKPLEADQREAWIETAREVLASHRAS